MIVFGIAGKPVKKAPMHLMEACQITSAGLTGDYYGSLRSSLRSSRQVSVLSLPQWREALEEIGTDVPWWMRRASLCLTEHRFSAGDVGKVLTIGNTVRLLITGECDPCKRMDDVFPGLQKALRPSWRGGVTCRVVRPGMLRVGDACSLA